MSSMQTGLPSWCHLSEPERELAVLSVHLPHVAIHSLHGGFWIHNEPVNVGNKQLIDSIHINAQSTATVLYYQLMNFVVYSLP